MRTVTATSRPEPRTSGPRKPASSAAKAADSRARTASAYSARTAMIASRGADGEGRDRDALHHGEGARLHEVAVRALRRVGLVAVGDHVADRVGRARPRPATCRPPGSRRRHARAGRTPRSWRPSRSGPGRRRTARRASNAPRGDRGGEVRCGSRPAARRRGAAAGRARGSGRACRRASGGGSSSDQWTVRVAGCSPASAWAQAVALAERHLRPAARRRRRRAAPARTGRCVESQAKRIRPSGVGPAQLGPEPGADRLGEPAAARHQAGRAAADRDLLHGPLEAEVAVVAWRCRRSSRTRRPSGG